VLGFRQQGEGAFLSVKRMPTKIIPGLFLFSTSVVLLLALASFQESGKSPQPTSPSFSSQDVRLLSAEEINRRTLALAAEIDDSAK
jgi:multisubunit Na+/H+ antiporter MnhC subunit